MAYDRYDARRDPRERWRSDEFSSRERGFRDRDERGFLERAGDEIASWFGDDEAERRRRPDLRDDERGFHGRERDWDRDRDFGQPRGRSDWDRDQDRGSLGGRSRFEERERGFRPSREDFARGGRREFGRDRFDREPLRPTFTGSSERAYDPHYSEWRNRQIDELDRDYDEYRREHQSKFESDFGDWRTRRQGKRQMLGSVREHMEVVGSDDQHVGTVDRVAGDRIILTKSDEQAGGAHHSIPCTMVDRIDDQRVILDCDAEQAKQKWRDDSRERALFEREDQGEAGPHILERSFSGTYR